MKPSKPNVLYVYLYYEYISFKGTIPETSTTSESSSKEKETGDHDSHAREGGHSDGFGDAKPNHDAAIAAGLVPVALVLLLGCLYWLYQRAHPLRANNERSYTMQFTVEPRRETPTPPLPSPTSTGAFILNENAIMITLKHFMVHLFSLVQFIHFVDNPFQVRVRQTRVMKSLKLK